MIDVKQIGRNIKELRKERGLTQKEFALIVSCLQDELSKWETGVRMPTYTRLVQLAMALGVDMNRLFEGVYKPEN